VIVRLGDILVEHGLLTEAQRLEIVEHQRVNPRPFGLLAEEMFGVSPRAVERAWADQFARMAEWVDPSDERIAEEARTFVDARQAWQFGVLPIRFEAGELLIATTEDRLARALRFAGWRIPATCRFVLCDEAQLHDALERHYPMAGLNADTVRMFRLASGL